ncbi:hypothetical protein CALVIDRAFT_534216 [Calocera viscosa TUFC12733]|uniref:Uncharacterized protein n=1 Tax=Calocera viscosa (strain TUFC12733) TaxID=1330018 RepID=A0A167QIL3_CALVF|nr:hypothetical protein CALVIDRAFT_534216 [Calocera viscosa TUFC12733]
MRINLFEFQPRTPMRKSCLPRRTGISTTPSRLSRGWHLCPLGSVSRLRTTVGAELAAYQLMIWLLFLCEDLYLLFCL